MQPFATIKRIVISVSLLCVLLTPYAQTNQFYDVVDATHGLSQGMVYDILQDKEGFIWVGTKDGLNRYDGYGFKVFTNEPNNNNTLSSNSINDLFEDSKGRIWVGTQNEGLNIYDKKTGNFIRIIKKEKQTNGLSSNIIKIIEESPDGKIMVATEDGKLHIFNLKDNLKDKEPVQYVSQLSLPNNVQVYGIGVDKNKNIWIGGMDGTVYQFDIAKNNFTQLPNAKLLNNGYFTKSEDILINNNLYLYHNENMIPLFDTNKYPEGNIILKPNQKLWDKHHRELSFYDATAWGTEKKINWSLKLPAEKRLIYPFVFDKSGIIWCGTVGYGLRKYNINKEKFNTSFKGFSVYNITPIANDDIFVSDVVYGWRRLSKTTEQKNAFNKIPQEIQLDNILYSKSGDFWMKSDNKGIFKYNLNTGNLKSYPNINDDKGIGSKQPIFEDSKNRIWFPGLGGTVSLIDKTTEQPTLINFNVNNPKPMDPLATTTAILEDKQGTFWIGTLNGFAKVIFENTNQKIQQVTWYHSSTTLNSLNYNHVTSFLEDPTNANVLWIGTRGGGVNRLDKTAGTFSYLTTKEGLPDNIVYGILSDNAGNIWGSTNKGIFCMMQTMGKDKEIVFRNYTFSDGLQDNEFNTNAFKKLPNGNLAFGGVKGLNIFDPKAVLAQNFTPNVFITNLYVNNKPILPNDKTGILKSTIEQTKSISLTHLQDIITLEFASLDFTLSTQNKYRYKLEGADKDWVEAGTNRYATYLHLPAGTYTFKVQGSNAQGIWSDKIAQLEIIVLPPWWRSWWAYLAYLLVLGFSIRGYFKFKVNKAKLKNELEFEQQEAKRVKELDAVKTQLYTNITHEFRTPLTVILGTAQQIKDNPAEGFDNGMNMILRNGNNLLKLVNELLDLSKLESGKMELQTVNGDVITFLRYIVESFQSLAESQKKQIHFLSEIDSLFVAYDGEKIRQITANLLSNALKFTPEKGNIYITIQAQQKSTLQSTLIIKVKDTGIGIPESEIESIFERFYQLDNSHTRNADGTGIGLALTKELVKLMNGTIEVKSPPNGANKGSEFMVTLLLDNQTENYIGEIVHPLPTAENHLSDAVFIEQSKVQKEQGVERKPLILLVEDNADVVAYTASCLPEYTLAVAKDGKEGIEIATNIIPDLIITDVMMPYVDGFELCNTLKNGQLTSHIPIIMLTAKADIESKLEGLAHGADVYLEKPFYKNELLLRIKKLLELRQKLQQYYSDKLGIKKPSAIDQEITIPNITLHQDVEHEFVTKLRDLVEANFNNYEFNVEQLCKLVFMSHSQLQRKLDAVAGISPNKFIRTVRLNKAKSLLKNHNVNISSIALDCGYADPGYFTRIFKQETGVTPQEWRTGNVI